MSRSISKCLLLICGLFLLNIALQAQITCYVTGSQDSQNVYGSASASVPYGNSTHLTTLRMTMSSAFGRTSQTWTSGTTLASSMSLFDSAGVEEDGSYYVNIEAEGNCFYNNSNHLMGSGNTTVFEPPKIFVNSFSVSPNQVKFYTNSNQIGVFTASISSSKFLKGQHVNFYTALVSTACGTKANGAQGECPPGYTVNPELGTDVDVVLNGVIPVAKSWDLKNTNSDNGNGGKVKLRVGTEATNLPSTVVVVNNWREEEVMLID